MIIQVQVQHLKYKRVQNSSAKKYQSLHEDKAQSALWQGIVISMPVPPK